MIVHSDVPITLIGAAKTPFKLLRAALKHAPRVVAADGGAATALRHGLLPEAVIGDFDSLPEDVRAALPADILHPVAEQDSTDFEKCLARIAAPLIIGAGFSGARLDHQLAVCNALVRWPAQRCILLGADDLVFLSPPELALDLPAGARVSLFPLGMVDARSDGLHWPLDGLVLTPDGQIGTSNVAIGPVHLSVTAPKLLVILPTAHLDQVAQVLLDSRPRWD